MTTQVEEKTHAELSPSGASRWMRCPGSVALSRGLEDTGSHYARWGTVCHEVADLILQDVIADGKWDPRCAESYIGRVFEVEGHELEFDMEMADCVNDYIAHVESFWAPDVVLLPETQVPLEHITGEKDATGTSDCVIVYPRLREICVIDLKGGKGVMVDAEENKQGLMYASGTIEEYDLLYGPFDKIRIVIIQPRLNHVSEWLLEMDEFEERIAEIKAAVKQVRLCEKDIADGVPWDTTGYLTPGEDQCRFCPAARNKLCPALDGMVVDTMSKTAPPARADEFPDLTLPKKAAAAVPDESVDHEALAEAWRALPLIEKWIEGVRNAVHSRLHDGKPVGSGDHQLTLYEGKRGARYWTDEDAAEERMRKSRVKADDRFTKTLISPTQAEKKLKDNKSLWADLAEYIDQNDGKPVVGLVGDEKRTPWSVCPPDDFPDLDAEEDDLFA